MVYRMFSLSRNFVRVFCTLKPQKRNNLKRNKNFHQNQFFFQPWLDAPNGLLLQVLRVNVVMPSARRLLNVFSIDLLSSVGLRSHTDPIDDQNTIT